MTQPDPTSPGQDDTGPTSTGPDDYALAPALRARLLGGGLTAVGVVVVIVVLLGALVGLPPP